MSDPWAVRIRRLLSDGYLFDPTEPFKKLEELTKGHLTFLEAYKKTGRILCISVVPDEPNHVTPAKVLNFMTAPDVLISSAICASCAIPLILPPIKLMCKTEAGDFVPYRGSGKLWRDGSIRSDIPDLSMLNVTFQIVSQVNPHITIFFYESQGSAGCPTPHRGGRGWRGGFIASSLIHMIDLDLKKWLRLCKDLKLLPPIMATDVSSVFLQQFDGTVTILPANSNVFPDCVHILDDPTPERLQEYITQGQLKAFPKLGMIGHRMRIEKSVQKFDTLVWKPKVHILLRSQWGWSHIPPRLHGESHRDLVCKAKSMEFLPQSPSANITLDVTQQSIETLPKISLCYSPDPFHIHWTLGEPLLFEQTGPLYSYKPLTTSTPVKTIPCQPMKGLQNSNWFIGWTGEIDDTYVLHEWDWEAKKLNLISPNPFENVHLLFEYAQAVDDVEVMGYGDVICFYHQAVDHTGRDLSVELIAFQQSPQKAVNDDGGGESKRVVVFEKLWRKVIPLRCLALVQMNSTFISISAISKSWPADQEQPLENNGTNGLSSRLKIDFNLLD
ncbi:UNVERIFIED_CONTAM: hypothetical protein HDU68_002732, partial [Siphonaria sp. JEL0065]